jgi:hypothetical protein
VQRAQLKAKLIVSGAFSLLLSFGEEKKVKETFWSMQKNRGTR